MIAIDFVVAKWDHDCCGHPFLRVEDRYGGRTAPTRGQCDCRCHEKDVNEVRRQLLRSAPKLLAALASQCIGCHDGWLFANGFEIYHVNPEENEEGHHDALACRLTKDERDLLRECGWKGGAS